MNYYRHFARQTLGLGFEGPFVFLLCGLFAVVAVPLMRALGGIDIPEESMTSLRLALVLNGLAFLGYAGIFLYAQRVFFREKKEKTLVMTLCSPARLEEIFWGKVAGLVAGGFVIPALTAFAAAAVFAPRGLVIFAAWDTGAALLIVAAAEIAFAALNGVFMLTAKDERSIAIVLCLFGGAHTLLTSLAGAPERWSLFGSPLVRYAAITAALWLLTGAAYLFLLSKHRVMESV